MRRWIVGLAILALSLALAGCGEQGKKEETTSGTEQQTQKQISDNASTEQKKQGAIDYDLTQMGSDMVYATMYQVMASPDDYVGKTFRIKGEYYPSFYQPTATLYHYCLIKDATACCAQGLEFVWDDGSHVYPDEYPKSKQEIVVEGVFELYEEEGDESLYCRLKDATLTVE